MIDALAERFAEAFIRALKPKLSALVDDEIKRVRAKLTEPADLVRDALKRYIP